MMRQELTTVRFIAMSVSILAIELVGGITPIHATVPVVEWIRQLGTSGRDHSDGVATDGQGHIFIAGRTSGTLAGTHFGSDDVFVGKFDESGNQIWTRQIGTPASDHAEGVASDRFGNVIVSGSTRGVLGVTSVGGNDAFASKFDSSGNLQWIEQFGTSAADFSSDVATDEAGSVYLSGGTFGALGSVSFGAEDAFVSKYDASGNLQWHRQMGAYLEDRAHALSVDSGSNALITGPTTCSSGSACGGTSDIFVAKYDASGNVLWTDQFGTNSSDNSLGVTADSQGNVYVAGQSFGSFSHLNAGASDVFISKHDATGNLVWISQFGSLNSDVPRDVIADESGNLYVSGWTDGELAGKHAGKVDVFLSKLDAAGNLLWIKQFGTDEDDEALGVGLDGSGGIYISGYTRGSLSGANAGQSDAFLAKIIEVPEPTSGAMLASACILTTLRKSKRQSRPIDASLSPQPIFCARIS